MRFTLEIELGNEGMQSLFDVLEATASSLKRYGAANHGTRAIATYADHAQIKDGNGNTVGGWEVSE